MAFTFPIYTPAGTPILINAGDNVQSIINAAPANAEFKFGAGTFVGPFTPRNGDSYYGTVTSNVLTSKIIGSTTLTGFASIGCLWRNSMEQR